MTVIQVTAGGPSGTSVLGYWLVHVKSGPHTGNSAVVWSAGASPSQPDISPTVLKQIGATSQAQVSSYYMGGAPKNLQSEFLRALGALNVSVDTIPVFPSSGTPQQILGSDLIKGINFDLINPVGTSKSGEAQRTEGVGGALQAGSNAVSSVFGSLGDWEQFALRVLEGLVGVALLFLGLQALTGIGDGTPAGAAAIAAKYVR